jgi:hypothetical protein
MTVQGFVIPTTKRYLSGGLICGLISDGWIETSNSLIY